MSVDCDIYEPSERIDGSRPGIIDWISLADSYPFVKLLTGRLVCEPSALDVGECEIVGRTPIDEGSSATKATNRSTGPPRVQSCP